MAFKQFSSRDAHHPKKQGPAKLIVTQASNGRTQIAFSAAVRDHLQPIKKFRVSLLVDKVTRQLAVVRVPDDHNDGNDFDVYGSSVSTMYIYGNALSSHLGLEPGHYLAELTTLPRTGGAHAAVIELDSRVDPATAPTGLRVAPTATHLTTTSSEERLRIAMIDQILNEGVVVVSTSSPVEDHPEGAIAHG